MSRYLTFIELTPKPKTKVIRVISKRSHILGDIKWYGPWRQYAFFPEKGTCFNTECLNDIQSYIKDLR